MSWEAVSTAIQTRLESLFPLAKAHNYIRNTRFGSDSDEFKAVYVSEISEPIAQVFQVTRTGFRQAKSGDDDSRWIVQHDVLVHYHQGVKDCDSSELDFQANIDSLCSNFRTGDRTLGSIAHTLSDPQATEIGHAMLAESVFCHYCPIKFTVEEVQ